jgi:hypothetical protein
MEQRPPRSDAAREPTPLFTLPCPDCGEPLIRRRRGMSLVYSCRKGHLFNPSEVLFAGLGGAEAALTAGARRTLEELEERLRGLATVARQADEPGLAEALDLTVVGTRQLGDTPRPATVRDDASRDGVLLGTIMDLLAIPRDDLRTVMDGVAQVVADALRADKVDVFLFDADAECLVALGTSDTPMGHAQKARGLDRLPLERSGRVGEVFQSGAPYLGGRADEDSVELREVSEGLGVRSQALVPLERVGSERGVLAAMSATPGRFSQQDVRFLEAMARWLALVVADRAAADS